MPRKLAWFYTAGFLGIFLICHTPGLTDDSGLSFAADDMIAVVLYVSQATTRSGNDQMARLTRDLIDLCATSGGRFFLPYQLHYTAEQLTRSYPEVRAFFEAKRRYDPTELFVNTFYERFGK